MENETSKTEIIISDIKTNNITGNISSTLHEEDKTQQLIFIFQSIISSVGIVANATVVVVFLKHKTLRQKVTNIFLINQSLIDFVCSVMLLLTTQFLKDAYHTVNNGILGDLECGIWNSKLFIWGPLVSSTWNLMCLTIERYLELLHPIWHKVHFKMKYLKAALIGCWVFGIGINAAYVIPTSKLVYGECLIYDSWPNETLKTVWGIIIIFIQFFIPFFILIFCYGKIVRMLSKRIKKELYDVTKQNYNSENNNRNQINNSQNDKFQLARRNTIKTLLIVGCCFIICWSQDQIFYFMYNCGYPVDWNSPYYHFIGLMVFLNSTVNPFVYLIMYKDYQKALKTFLSCEKTESNEVSNSNSNTNRS